MQIHTERKRAIMKVENAVRGDSGPYSLTLKNPKGECSGKCNVTVVGKPAAPKGPLKTKDVHGHGCTLEWEPPEDDGGEELEEYIVEAQDMNEKGKFVEVGRCGPKDTQFKVPSSPSSHFHPPSLILLPFLPSWGR